MPMIWQCGVFRDNPAVLTEFESTLPRQTVQPRGARGKGAKGSLAPRSG
jgi:hypothetical protein